METTLLAFFKALADETRLKIVGLLAQQPYSVGELAAILGLKDPTVSHHLAKLAEADLVTMKREGTTHFYCLDVERLHTWSQEILNPQRVAALAPAVEVTWEDKILQTFTDGQQLKQIPSSYRKKLVILEWLAGQFAPDQRYSEAEVNATIQRHHADSATLRRELVMNKFMDRQGGYYWRLSADETRQHTRRLLESEPLK